ncbi:hypothetical protein, partial [Advenella faeciporci]|uniref:hypothetical protein n=1 Tax=Advenella faeciporci TaxID=797535 RepID=UPI001E3E0D6B
GLQAFSCLASKRFQFLFVHVIYPFPCVGVMIDGLHSFIYRLSMRDEALKWPVKSSNLDLC